MFRIKYTEIPGNPPKLNKEFIGNPVDEYSDRFDNFSNFYGIKVLLIDDEFHKRNLLPRQERVCRFCKSIYSEKEKFKKIAHLLPSLIGNKNLFSDFECDSCNELFGKYENNLANFLGVARVMNMENVKSGHLKFKSPDKTLIVEKDKEARDPKLKLESHGSDNTHHTLNLPEKKITFHSIRHSYNPNMVWKAFLKMGLSILPDQYIDDYEIAFKLLRSNIKNEETDNPLYKVNMYFHPGPPFPSPMAILFERKDASKPMPMHIACIMFQNYTYQLVLPFSKNDEMLYRNKITVPIMPPFIDKHFAAEYGMPTGHLLNFNLDELKKGEKHDVTFTFESYKDSRMEGLK